MKIISSLIDFTDTSKKATNYACWMAKKQKATVNLLHIASESEGSSKDVEERLIEFTGIDKCGLDYNVSIGDGNYLRQIPKLLQLSNADLVVIGTHGTKGIFQTLFGANVLKLIQSISIPALVVQDHTPSPERNFNKILFPIAPHDNFEIKINTTAEWAKLFDSKIEIFCLFKSGSTLPDNLNHNLELSKRIFDKKKVAYNPVLKESVVYSVGYAREILEYADTSAIDLISIMSQNSEENRYFGNVDKTNIILNASGIPVLCIGS